MTESMEQANFQTLLARNDKVSDLQRPVASLHKMTTNADHHCDGVKA